MRKRSVALLLLFAMMALLLAGCGKTTAAAKDIYRSIEDLQGKRIGVQTGTVFDVVAREQIPACEVVYFNAATDLPVALESGKIDAYFNDEAPTRLMLEEYPSQTILEIVYEDNFGYIFPKNDPEAEKHCRQMNEFLAKIRANGTLAEIEEIWFSIDESRQLIDTASLTGENGTLTMITEGSYPPFSSIVNGAPGGYDVDIAARFCREYGYNLEVVLASFDGMLSAVAAGKADFGASGVSITEERKETMLFSDPNYTGGAAIIVKKEQSAVQNGTVSAKSIEDLRGKTIGVLSGSVHDKIAEDGIPGCRVEYFNAMTDLPLALENGKIDAYINEEPVARVMLREYPAQSAIATLRNDSYGFIFPKNDPKAEKLCQQLSEYLAEIKADGTLQEIDAIWFGEDESLKKVDYSFTGENGTVVPATDPSLMPFSYLVGEDIGGYDIDIAARFCRKYGYQLEVVPSAFSGVLAGLSSGKFDCAACCITITEERRESFLFSEPDYVGGIVVVAKTDAKDEVGYSIAESFRKTFIREDRWKLFVRGIGVTLTITLLSCLFGTALGFLLFLVYRKEYKALNLILDGIMDVLGKSPIVVILMILFYIIFGSSELSGLWVSVIGFSVLFAFSFVGIVKVGVSAVDPGQVEASLALGFTDTQTFLHVTLPQAARLFLPGYKNNIVSLLKDTAVVGYVTVQDLTKVSDIVRSRTYEAFFPLIATAIIYFLLAGCLTQLVRRLEFGADPTHRSPEKILKGVERK